MPFDIEIDEYHEDRERNLKYFEKFRDIVFYESAKCCLFEKRIKRFIIFFRKLPYILKFKITVFYLFKIVNLLKR